MSELWELKALGEVYDVRDGTHDSPKYHAVGFPLVTSKNLKKDGVSFEDVNLISEQDYVKVNQRSAVHKGDVLFAMIGTIGNPALVTTEPNFAIKNVALFKVPNSQSGSFLRYYLSSEFVVSKMIQEAKGTTQKFVGLGYLRNFPIKVPSLREQQRLVSLLDEAVDVIARARANAERNLRSARELFENHLQSVFARRGEGWEVRALGEIATFRNGINFTKSSKGESIKILGVKDFKANYWAPLDTLESVVPDGMLPDLDMLQQDDLVFVRSNGNPELIGRCLLIGEIGERTTHSGFTIRARLNTTEVLPKYLCHLLKSNSAHREMIEGGNGSNIKSLNQGTLARLVVPFPSIPEQARIIGQLEELQKKTKSLEAIYQQKIMALDALEESILHKAFSGNL